MESRSAAATGPSSQGSSKLLVYDGECPLCAASTAFLVRLRLVRPAARRSHLEFESDALARLQAAGFQDELAVLDAASGEIRSGSDGLLWILSDSWAGPLARACSRTPLRQILRVPYRFVAFNRRFISLPRPHGVRCACEPTEHRGYNISFILVAYMLAFIPIAYMPARANRGAVADWWMLCLFAIQHLGVFLVVMMTGDATRRLPFLAHLCASFVGFFVPFTLLSIATGGASGKLHGREFAAFAGLAALLGIRWYLGLVRRMRYLGFRD